MLRTDIKLKYCPCCGKPGQLNDVFSKVNFRHGWVGCPSCKLYIQWTHDYTFAVMMWNTRVIG